MPRAFCGFRLVDPNDVVRDFEGALSIVGADGFAKLCFGGPTRLPKHPCVVDEDHIAAAAASEHRRQLAEDRRVHIATCRVPVRVVRVQPEERPIGRLGTTCGKSEALSPCRRVTLRRRRIEACLLVQIVRARWRRRRRRLLPTRRQSRLGMSPSRRGAAARSGGHSRAGSPASRVGGPGAAGPLHPNARTHALLVAA